MSNGQGGSRGGVMSQPGFGNNDQRGVYSGPNLGGNYSGMDTPGMGYTGPNLGGNFSGMDGRPPFSADSGGFFQPQPGMMYAGGNPNFDEMGPISQGGGLGKPAPGYTQGPGGPPGSQNQYAGPIAAGGGFAPGSTGNAQWEQNARANLGVPLYAEGNAGRGYMPNGQGMMVPRSSVLGQGGYADRVAGRMAAGGPQSHLGGPAEGGYQSSAGQKIGQNAQYAQPGMYPQWTADPTRRF